MLPIRLEGTIIRGKGRGGKRLNCPTANLDCEVPETLDSGVWAGYATIISKRIDNDDQVPSTEYKALISVGESPFYGDLTTPVIEVHLIGYTGDDFYGSRLEVGITRWIRAMRSDFANEAELRACIQHDIACIDQ
jgi:FAD synthase